MSTALYCELLGKSNQFNACFCTYRKPVENSIRKMLQQPLSRYFLGWGGMVVVVVETTIYIHARKRNSRYEPKKGVLIKSSMAFHDSVHYFVSILSRIWCDRQSMSVILLLVNDTEEYTSISLPALCFFRLLRFPSTIFFYLIFSISFFTYSWGLSLERIILVGGYRWLNEFG